LEIDESSAAETAKKLKSHNDGCDCYGIDNSRLKKPYHSPSVNESDVDQDGCQYESCSLQGLEFIEDYGWPVMADEAVKERHCIGKSLYPKEDPSNQR
jgi:hypothetical protein